MNDLTFTNDELLVLCEMFNDGAIKGRYIEVAATVKEKLKEKLDVAKLRTQGDTVSD